MEDRLIQIVKKELGILLTPAFAAMLMAEAQAFYPKSRMPAWMDVYVRLSRLRNRPFHPEFAIPVYVVAYVRRPYRKLQDRLVYEKSLSVVTPF